MLRRIFGWLKKKPVRKSDSIWTVQANPVPMRLRGAGFPPTPEDWVAYGPFVKGTAPSTTSDLAEVIRRVEESIPNVRWEQTIVTHPSDDDGLWFFWIPSMPGDVQLESSYSVCPFDIETDKHDERFRAQTPQEAAEVIIKWLGMPGGRAKSPWYQR